MEYGHLTIAERKVILNMRAWEARLREMGERLGRSKGTISRELSRNAGSA